MVRLVLDMSFRRLGQRRTSQGSEDSPIKRAQKSKKSEDERIRTRTYVVDGPHLDPVCVQCPRSVSLGKPCVHVGRAYCERERGWVERGGNP